jgi:hypothetical protein
MVSILPIDIELGIFAGLAVAMAGYLKEYSKVDAKGAHTEKFSIDKFATTVILGAIIGGILSYLSLIDEGVLLFLSTAGTVSIVEDLMKGIMRLKKD